VFIERTGDVALAYLGIGVLMIAIPLGFAFSPAWRLTTLRPPPSASGG